METESNSLLTLDLLPLAKFATDFLNCVPTFCPYHAVSVLAVLLYEGHILQKWILCIFS